MNEQLFSLVTRKGTFVWAVIQLQNGYILSRKVNNLYVHYMLSPKDLSSRYEKEDGSFTWWNTYALTREDFKAEDWEILK